MEETFFSRGVSADFPLNPDQGKNQETIPVEKTESTQTSSDLASNPSSSCYYRLANNIIRPPSSFKFKKVKGNHHCHCNHNQCYVPEPQCSRLVYHNNNFSGNFDNNPSLHNNMQQNSRPEIVECNPTDESYSRNGGMVEKKTLWQKMRKLLGISKHETTDSQFIEPQLSDGFEMTELLVHDLRKYGKFTAFRSKANTHIVEVTFPSIHVTSNYAMTNYQFLSRKLSGNGEMDLVFNDVKVKLVVPTIKDYRQNTLKKINSDIQIKFKRLVRILIN